MSEHAGCGHGEGRMSGRIGREVGSASRRPNAPIDLDRAWKKVLVLRVPTSNAAIHDRTVHERKDPSSTKLVVLCFPDVGLCNGIPMPRGRKCTSSICPEIGNSPVFSFARFDISDYLIQICLKCDRSHSRRGRGNKSEHGSRIEPGPHFPKQRKEWFGRFGCHAFPWCVGNCDVQPGVIWIGCRAHAITPTTCKHQRGDFFADFSTCYEIAAHVGSRPQPR